MLRRKAETTKGPDETEKGFKEETNRGPNIAVSLRSETLQN